MLFQMVASILTAFILASIEGRKLAGYVALYTPLFFIVLCCFGARIAIETKRKQEQHANLGAYTEEMLSALKLVVAFG